MGLPDEASRQRGVVVLSLPMHREEGSTHLSESLHPAACRKSAALLQH